MDKKSKEALRRYKKSRQQAQSSSDSSSSSDSESGSSSSYSSSSSGRKAAERHRKKKARQAAVAARRSSSSSGDERRKREKREHACQKKLEAKRNHLKRKLKEAKLKKRAAAAAAAALSGHSHRSLSPATQAKLKKLAERKHQRAASKERREREREKHRAARGEREHHTRESRSPTKITKIRIHQDVKQRQKSPTRVHHQLMSREKIIIQARTRDRTPSAERQRHEHKIRHHDEALRERERRDRERAEREAARDKERAEALARCQERQRERERIAREKLRREEEEKKYAGTGLVGERERLLPRPAEREMAIAAARGYNSRERSLEAVERIPRHASKRDLELYECEREYLEAERRGLLDREELRREREYLVARRRELSPVSEHYVGRLRSERDLYAEEERERAYSRAYLDEARHPRERDIWMDPRELRERELREMREVRDLRELEQLRDLYPEEREHMARERERTLAGRGDWKDDWAPVVERGDWDDGAGTRVAGFIGGPVRGGGATVAAKIPPSHEKRASSEPDWDAEENEASSNLPSSSRDGGSSRGAWDERESTRDQSAVREKHVVNRSEHADRRWASAEWRDGANETGTSHVLSAGRGGELSTPSHHLHREPRGPRGFRRGGIHQEHGERLPGGGSSYRSHAPPPLMTLPVQPPGSSFHGSSSTPRFPNKRNMTYTNPNLIRKQQAALAAAKAAAQASAVAAATTAVAAAKAAAQSAANATTNPGILGQVGSAVMKQQEAVTVPIEIAAEKPEAGEIVGDTDSPNNGSDAEDSGSKQAGSSIEFVSTQVMDAKTSGELSEISDSDDDILDKEPTKASSIPEASTIGTTDAAINGSNEVASLTDPIKLTIATDDSTTNMNEADKQDEEDLLDFEEISDGELEEDARNKGVGDALGVDWASLIAETKRQAANANPQESEQTTTAKQKWQPHRILLDVGISMRMAGEDYAKQLLQDAKQKLAEELGQLKVKSEIKDEISSTGDEDSSSLAMDSQSGFSDDKKLSLKSTLSNLDDCDVAQMHPLAGIQVAERARRLERRSLISNACGAHSRALSARQDLKLRRQLCGFPARECGLPRPLPLVSSKLKAMALAAFQRTLEVK